MLTLLLAEDEFYTRKGLIKHLDFASLGIDNILEAADGREGLSLAHENRIDILLTDVKMPHMDGIELAKSIRVLYPDCIIMFLSGYSDKEYLRSALSLRTFRYIDKPVDTDFLMDSLSEAVILCKRKSTSYHYNIEETEKTFARSLVRSGSLPENFSEQLQLLELTPGHFNSCRTILIQFLNSPEFQAMASDFSPLTFIALRTCKELLKEYNFESVCSEYRECYLIIHILTPPERTNVPFPKQRFHFMLQELSERLSNYPHFISVGNMVASASQLVASYNSAVISLQTNYYTGIGSISYADNAGNQVYEMSNATFTRIQQAVINQDEQDCKAALEEIYQGFYTHTATLINSTKTSYHKLLYWLFQYINSKYPDTSLQTETFLWEATTNSTTLDELHTFAVNYFETYFSKLHTAPDASTSSAIMQVIGESYSDSSLSIQYISDKLNLSCSYLSYIFKQESGQTINQYIQSVRIQKAKELLSGTDLKILEVAVRCGYPDSNYFTKLFRKTTGFLPSEYREANPL